MSSRAALGPLAVMLALVTGHAWPAAADTSAANGAVAQTGAAAGGESASRRGSLTVTVTADDGAPSPGKPIASARVVVTLAGGEETQGDTDATGKIRFDRIAYGALKVQVLKTGWETAGSAFALDAPTKVLGLKLKPDLPPAQ